jgi:hypothetical protein
MFSRASEKQIVVYHLDVTVSPFLEHHNSLKTEKDGRHHLGGRFLRDSFDWWNSPFCKPNH